MTPPPGPAVGESVDDELWDTAPTSSQPPPGLRVTPPGLKVTPPMPPAVEGGLDDDQWELARRSAELTAIQERTVQRADRVLARMSEPPTDPGFTHH